MKSSSQAIQALARLEPGRVVRLSESFGVCRVIGNQHESEHEPGAEPFDAARWAADVRAAQSGQPALDPQTDGEPALFTETHR